MRNIATAHKLGTDICEALGIPAVGVVRVAFAVDLGAADPVKLEVTRLIDWDTSKKGALGVKEVIERYFTTTLEGQP